MPKTAKSKLAKKCAKKKSQGKSAPAQPDEMFQFRNILGQAVDQFEENCPPVPSIDKMKPDMAVKVLGSYVQGLQQAIQTRPARPVDNLLDRCLGLQRWHIGKALLLIKPLGNGAKGLMHLIDMTYQEFCEKYDLGDRTTEWRSRAIAHHYPRREDVQRHGWQWQAMVEALPRLQRSSESGSNGDGPGKTGKTSKQNKIATGRLVPIGNIVTRIVKACNDLEGTTATILKTIQDGKNEGAHYSSAKEVASFKGFVPEVESAMKALLRGQKTYLTWQRSVLTLT